MKCSLSHTQHIKPSANQNSCLVSTVNSYFTVHLTMNKHNYYRCWLHIELVLSIWSVWLLWSSRLCHCPWWNGTFSWQKRLDSSTRSAFPYCLVDLEIKYQYKQFVTHKSCIRYRHVIICANKDTTPVFWHKAKCAMQVCCWCWCEGDTSGCGRGCVRPAFDELFWSQCCTWLCFSCFIRRKWIDPCQWTDLLIVINENK